MASKAISPRDGREHAPAASREAELDRLRSALEGIRYGEVRVVIQDGVIVQIERVERQRLR
jgi:hypothetical protein